jgi:hypothetical protein
VVEELALIRCDLDNARSEVGLLRVHAARAACVMAATADSCRRHLTTVDDGSRWGGEDNASRLDFP